MYSKVLGRQMDVVIPPYICRNGVVGRDWEALASK